MKKNYLLGSLAILAILAGFSLGNGASASTSVTFSPSQEGTIRESFDQQAVVEVFAPVGAVSLQTTFNLRLVAATEDILPLAGSNAFVLSNKIYSLETTDALNRKDLNFNKNLTVTISMVGMPGDTSSLGVYYFNEPTREWKIISESSFSPAKGRVNFGLSRPTTFAIISGEGQATIRSSQVLGAKEYGNGSLLRGADGRIYVIANGQKQRIMNLKELNSYAGRTIYKVDNSVLASYPEVLGVKVLANGTLIRGTDYKIYIIVNGKKQPLRTLAELQKYSGQKIYNLSDAEMASY